MASPPNIRRIRAEDFDEQYQELVNKLAFAINEFQDQVIFNLNKGLDFQNLNQDIKDVEVVIDSNGDLVNPPNIKTNLKSKPRLVFVGNTSNLLNPQITPLSAPSVTFTVDTTSDGNIVRLQGVTGLYNNVDEPNGSRYRLTLLIIGENL